MVPRVKTASAVRMAASSEINLVEHEMPIMKPYEYEAALHAALASQGEVLRWYIGQIDEERGIVIAECVVLSHSGTPRSQR